MASFPSVAVIIPTLNGAKWLERVFSMLRVQTLCPAEILVLDSGSTDETCDIVKKYQIDLRKISSSEFDHGGTRTLGARLTTSEILVYMTQDAVPVTEDALERLVAPLAENIMIAATYGRQLAVEDATVFSKHLRLFNYPDTSEIRCLKDRERLGFKTIFISNSFAAYQRDILAAHDYFPGRLLFGEDTLTVAMFLESGYCVEYVSEAKVHHSHNYTMWQEFKRYFDIGVFHVEQQDRLMKFGGPGGRGKEYVLSELRMLTRHKKIWLVPESFLRNSCKFIGYALGKHYNLFPRTIAASMSMNRRWWSEAD